MQCLDLVKVSYSYEGSREAVLKDVSASFQSGRVYTVIGESGAGKSTLLSLISGLDVCSKGDIYYKGKNLKNLDRDDYRSKSIGVIFQNFNLLLNSTAIYNITLSMSISDSVALPTKGRKEAKDFAYTLLGKVGIDRETAGRKILSLSGGEQQRVGIARALAHDPDVIIADEPTGNLDEGTERDVLNILVGLAHEENKCVIIVTHSDNVTSVADEVIGIRAGRLLSRAEYQRKTMGGIEVE